MDKLVAVCFTLILLGFGALIAIDQAQAELYVSVIALVTVLATVLTFGILLHRSRDGAEDRDRREAYARVMIALVTATAGTAGGIGGGAVVSSGQTMEAKTTADAANRKADKAGRKADKAGRKADKAGRKADKAGRP